MILQSDGGGAFHSHAGVGLVLAAGDDALQLRAAQFALGHFAAIEPVLHVIAIHDDAALVELAHGAQCFARRVDQRVDGGGESVGCVVRVRGVIQHLVFKAHRAVAGVAGIKQGGAFFAFGEEVFHAAVAHGADAPLELKLEVREHRIRHQIAARAIGSAIARWQDEAAVSNLPRPSRDGWLPIRVPARRAAAIKQQLSARRLFLRREGVGIGS